VCACNPKLTWVIYTHRQRNNGAKNDYHSSRTHSDSNRSTVDYKKLCADFGIGDDVVKQYTKTAAVFSIKVTSR
jgi:hypothetical protein